VIVQEYLPGAEQGDVRMFLLNGLPFAHKGKFAAFLRKSKSGDMRSNMHAGGEAEPATIGDDALAIADLIRPKLVQDGMFLVGLDIVGKKLMEINVFSPGGMYSIKRLTRVNFARLLIEDLERKVAYRSMYRTALTNRQLATM
jgi:glutathione synthase